MALLTAVYVLATVVLVWVGHRANAISEQNVRDLTKLEQERLRPLVEVRIESDAPLLVLRVTNQGQTPAYGIRIETTPTLQAVMGGKSCYPEAKTEKPIGVIEHGMGSLGAGSSEVSILGTFSRVEEVYPEMHFKGNVTYRSFTGVEYTSPINLDLRYMKGALRLNRKTIHDVAKQLEEIRRELGLLASGFHKPQVIVQSIEDKRAEDEASMNDALAQLDQITGEQEATGEEEGPQLDKPNG